MDKDKIKALNLIQYFRDNGLLPDYMGLGNEGVEDSLLRVMVAEGLLFNGIGGVFSLTDKGEKALNDHPLTIKFGIQKDMPEINNDVFKSKKNRRTNEDILRRKQQINELHISDKFDQKSESYNIFTESCDMFIYGFFRGASVFFSFTIESLLREKYKENNFKKLIEKAQKDGLIKQSDEHYLNGLRLDRNSLVHNSSREINENESLMIIHIVIRLMEKIL